MTAPRGPGPGLVSVVVPCPGSAEATRRCLAAVLRHSRPPWELIAVTRGDDPTALYLAGVADAAAMRVETLAGPGLEGHRDAWARGVRAARGEYVALVGPEVIVTDAWMEQLVGLAGAEPGIGITCPMIGGDPPPGAAAESPYSDAEGLHRFAARWRGEHRGKWRKVEVPSGPCLLVGRRLLEAIGAFDGPPDPGLFGEDLCRRARDAGFSAAVAHDLFIHSGPWPSAPVSAPAPSRTRIVALPPAEFVRRFGDPDTARALCAYTPPGDTHAVLTLLAHARPRRVLEVGTALGHMTANLTEWSPDDARVVSVGAVRGADVGGALEQAVEDPEPVDLGRLAGRFGKAHKAEVVAADSRGFDFARAGPFDFAFVDGGHAFDVALHDSRAAYAALAPGGWLVWHDMGHPAPWVRVREAVEAAGFAEPVEHVEGTMVAFLRKRGGALRLAWEGDVDGLHSLGLINRALCRALLGRGVDLGLSAGSGAVTPERLPADPALEPLKGRAPAGGPPDVFVAHRWPPRLEQPPAGRWAFFQPWEFGSLPRAWLAAATRADEVWAYSRSVRDVYLDAGVSPERVHVVPLGVDPDVFRPGIDPAPLPPGPGFRFVFVGGTIHRKGIDVLLAAYGRAFGPGEGVGLVVQDMGSRSFYRGQTAGAAVAALRDRGYPVEYREDPLTPAGLAALYAACDCAVQPYRGEGFALPAAEAMACGLPVIVTGAGPALDYASDETAFLIPAVRAELPADRVGEIETVGRPWLWEPDVGALAELMRRVASDPATARARGSAAARSIRDRFTWGHSAAAVEARLRDLAERSGLAGRPDGTA